MYFGALNTIRQLCMMNGIDGSEEYPKGRLVRISPFLLVGLLSIENLKKSQFILQLHNKTLIILLK